MNKDELKAAALDRWPSLLQQVAGIDSQFTSSNKHGPCPKCDGVDRWRFTDREGSGSAICNQCGKFGDGIAVIQWFKGIEFTAACSLVAEALGGKFESSSKGNGKPKKKEKHASPVESIATLSSGNREAFARDFARAKPGCSVEQIMRCKFAAARWPVKAKLEHQVEVLAFVSVKPPGLKDHSFILYRRNGQPFKAYGSLGERKAHILGATAAGQNDGLVIVGSVDEFKTANLVFKCEGLPDALAVASVLQPGEVAVSNMCGADSFLASWKPAFEGKQVIIIGDNDPNGAGLIGANKVAKALLQ